MNLSAKDRSGPTSLSRTNSMLKEPAVVEQRDASTANTAVHFRWKFTTSECPDAFDDRLGLHISWLTARVPLKATRRLDSRKAERRNQNRLEQARSTSLRDKPISRRRWSSRSDSARSWRRLSSQQATDFATPSTRRRNRVGGSAGAPKVADAVMRLANSSHGSFSGSPAHKLRFPLPAKHPFSTLP